MKERRTITGKKTYRNCTHYKNREEMQKFTAEDLKEFAMKREGNKILEAIDGLAVLIGREKSEEQLEI